MAPAYKLIYFNTRGAAESIRFLLKYGEIEFEDIRVEKDDWPQMKDKTPFGQLPVLEHNGKQVAQSLAIARYLAKVVKLAGNTDWENLEIDAIVDTITDSRTKLAPIFYEKDESKKKELTETFINEHLAFVLPRLEAVAQKNKGHLAVGRLTWADFYWAHLSPALDLITKNDTLANYPNLKAVRETVHALPAIKKWIETRPKTEF